MTGVAVLYAHYQGLTQVQSIFFGVGPAVMEIIAIAAFKLARSTNKRDPVLWAVAVIVGAATVISGAEIVWLFVASGVFGAIYYGGGLPRLPSRAAGLVPLPLAAAGAIAGAAIVIGRQTIHGWLAALIGLLALAALLQKRVKIPEPALVAAAAATGLALH